MLKLKNIQIELLYKELKQLSKGHSPIIHSYNLATIINSISCQNDKLIEIYTNYYNNILNNI